MCYRFGYLNELSVPLSRHWYFLWGPLGGHDSMWKAGQVSTLMSGLCPHADTVKLYRKGELEPLLSEANAKKSQG
jgi:hypothetical protein